MRIMPQLPMGTRDDVCWRVIHHDTEEAMPLLRSIFPEAKADEMNFVLFSTSGIHGSYLLLEEVEAAVQAGQPEDEIPDLTFLVVRPRVVGLQYGTCAPRTPEDFTFLPKLRATSLAAVAKIGV